MRCASADAGARSCCLRVVLFVLSLAPLVSGSLPADGARRHPQVLSPFPTTRDLFLRLAIPGGSCDLGLDVTGLPGRFPVRSPLVVRGVHVYDLAAAAAAAATVPGSTAGNATTVTVKAVAVTCRGRPGIRWDAVVLVTRGGACPSPSVVSLDASCTAARVQLVVPAAGFVVLPAPHAIVFAPAAGRIELPLLERGWNDSISVQFVAQDARCTQTHTLVVPPGNPRECVPTYVRTFEWETADLSATSAIFALWLAICIGMIMTGFAVHHPMTHSLAFVVLFFSFIPVMESMTFTTYVLSTATGCAAPFVCLGVYWVRKLRRLGSHRMRIPSPDLRRRVQAAAAFASIACLMLVMSSRFSLY